MQLQRGAACTPRRSAIACAAAGSLAVCKRALARSRVQCAASRPWGQHSAHGGAPVQRTTALNAVSSDGSTAEIPVKEWAPPAEGFQVYRITGDGACLFRAIVQGAQMASGKPPMPLQSETTAAFNLRTAVVEELRQRRSEMEAFIAGITDDWEGYLQRMAHPATWGGEPEMVMSVNLIKRPITVMRLTLAGRSVEPVVTYGEELAAGGKVAGVNLLWSGAHYDVLVQARPGSAPGAQREE